MLDPQTTLRHLYPPELSIEQKAIIDLIIIIRTPDKLYACCIYSRTITERKSLIQLNSVLVSRMQHEFSTELFTESMHLRNLRM